ncbi:MAG: SagB/ThcOx family dehydrogenase [Candidatus Omnitrophica bacterium]|nr:SagB/ThcOx family dehydrogenase [Candidatus Omnitrophota bacterium]
MRAKLVYTAIFLSLLTYYPLQAQQTTADIALPQPSRQGGASLLSALWQRQSQRSFKNARLPEQILSDLLWAAGGINRPETGLKTAPSAMNAQEIAIYAALEQGLYRYDATTHQLILILAKDMRAYAGRQDFLQQAPVCLIFVADMNRIPGDDTAAKQFYAALDTGYISQNVYLYCAAQQLATVAIGWVDKQALAAAMNLPQDHVVILTQPVGYPQ